MNMKRFICVITVLLLALTVVTTPAATKSATVYKLKWNGYFAANSVNAKLQERFFMDRVAELSEGRIQWQYFPSKQLGKDQLTIIGGGTAQAGYMVPPLYNGKIPILGAVDMPFLYKNTDFAGHIRTVSAILHHQEIVNALAKHNLKVLLGSSTGTFCIWLKKPVKVMANFKGLKIRGAGKMQSATFTALGASAQSLHSSEVYLALSTGVIEGSGWSATSAWDNKIYEVTKYGVIPPGSVGGNSALLVMNMDTYNKLPKDLQDVLAQAGAEAEKYIEETAVKNNEKMLANLAAKGMEIYTVPRDEIERWRTATQSVYDKWLKANGTAGQRVLDFALRKLGEK